MNDKRPISTQRVSTHIISKKWYAGIRRNGCLAASFRNRGEQTMNNLARLALFPILVCAVPAFAEDAFKPQCKLPYAAIAKKNAIDVTCPPEGRPSSSAHASEY